MSFRNLYKTLLLYTFICGGMQFWAALLHTVKPIPLENLPINFNTAVFHSWPIMSGLLWFAVAHIALGLLFTGIIAVVAFFFAQFWRLSAPTTKQLAIGLWCLAALIIWLANQYYFPWSIFAILLPTSLGPFSIKACLVVLSILFVCVCLIALLELIHWIKRPIWYAIIGIFIFSIALTLALSWGTERGDLKNLGNSVAKPNIIIIGIDSLRPDFTQLTPNIATFINTAANFTNASTPLARTFPAWMSILTGEYPIHNGARLSLPDQSTLNVENTLAKQLQQAGYKTIFGIDEQRFSNIDKHFGFDVILGPAIGLNDFVLGQFNDFPFSNLLVNTRLGHFLFPYNHANRAANTTYLPTTFNQLIAEELQQNQHKPLFLAIHYCLPHWPFAWAHTPFFKTTFADELHQLQYENSLQVVDQQFSHLMTLLAQYKLLNNALVFVMSDHGQGLGLAGERLTPINKYVPSPIKMDAATLTALTRRTYGHGTDVLNRSQYHIVLAMKHYATQGFSAKNINTPVSLVDLMPTILDYLHIPNRHKHDGISLLPLLEGQSLDEPARSFYMETGLTIPGILIANPTLEIALHEGLKYFTIQPHTGRVIVKSDFIPLIITGKQRAIMTDQWLLANYPISKKHAEWVLVNLKNGVWTNDLNTPFAKNSPAATLKQQLKTFYGEEIN